jgi:uncharacterized membrane protein YgcG
MMTTPYQHAPRHWVIFPNGLPEHVFGADSAEHALEVYLAALNPPLTEQDYARAVQEHVDATARGRGYDSGVSLASYAGSAVATWAAEAAAFVGWRDAVWVYVYAQLAAVQAEEREQPTVAELIAELPVIAWPA